MTVSKWESNAGRNQPKVEKLRRILFAKLPSQETLDLIQKTGNGWWLARRYSLPYNPFAKADKILGHDSLESLAREPPIIIARALIFVVMGLQQLPPGMNHEKLGLPCAIEEYMDTCVSVIATRAAADDEMVGSIEGLECLAMLAKYQSNAGKPRSAWLWTRRALNVAQLMGIHKHSTRLLRVTETVSKYYMEELWYRIVAADQYLSLLLGLQYGVAVDPSQLENDIDVDNSTHTRTFEERYYRKSLVISSYLIDRNQSATTPSYATTEDINEKLEAVANEMPDWWWEVPTGVTHLMTEDSGRAFDRTVAHIWHFQLIALLHLPFMLHDEKEQRHEYSKFACLTASREMIKRYVNLRENNRTFSCKILDFEIFTAAVTLLLSLLGSEKLRHGQAEGSLENDWELVDTLIALMGSLEGFPGEMMANQGIKVLKALREISQSDEKEQGSLRLTIPYFGTVNISIGTDSPQHQVKLEGSIFQPESTPEDPSHNSAQQMPPEMLRSPDLAPSFPVVSFEDNSASFLGYENATFFGEWSMQTPNSTAFQNIFDSDWNNTWNPSLL
jgi:hypothetical protein